MRRKTLFLLPMLLALSLSLAGCVDVKVHVVVNRDGSGDLVGQLLMDPIMLGLLGPSGTGDPLSNIAQESRKSGFATSLVTDHGKKGIECKKHFANISTAFKEGGDLFGSGMHAPFNIGQGLTIRRGFFKTDFKFKTDLDLSSMGGNPSDSSDEERAMAQVMLRSLNIDFALTLPVMAKSSNASEVEDNGRTLVWRLIPGAHNQITVEAEAWNVRNLILLSCLVVGLAIMGGMIAVRRRRHPGVKNFGDNLPHSDQLFQETQK